ncbi:hypothetical protein [Rheinheimera baltica]|jgi:uncharacterized protein YceK|uniref:hypothetical protein n=1 Tax=Rheinheimera baltica TaxID=67576 RepID=UPI0004061AE6|nr:hypothetical protein [Rheinheimera baltica]
MKKVVVALTLGVTLVMSGCSTILTEDTQKINVATSNGKSAEITIDGQSYQAPGIITVKKSQEQTKIITTTAEGCSNQTALNRQVEPTFFVNILSGGAFGSTTDYATEKMWKYDDNITISCGN